MDDLRLLRTIRSDALSSEDFFALPDFATDMRRSATATTDLHANVARFCANPVEYVPLARSLLISQFAWAKEFSAVEPGRPQ